MAGADRDRSAGGDRPPGATPASGAAPADVAALLRTFSAAPSRRPRQPRPDAPTTIVPLLRIPEPGDTALDPGRIDAARRRLKVDSLPEPGTGRTPGTPAEPARPEAFDEARERLRRRPRGG